MKNYHRNVGIEISSSMTLDQQLEEAGLNWTVKTSPITYGDRPYKTTDFNMAYRSDTGLPLDVYGSQRKPFQNRDILELFHNFCELNDLTIERLGSIKNGLELFAIARLPVQLDVKKVGDISDIYLLINESHKLGRGLKVDLFFNRLVCTNGMVKSVNMLTGIINHNAEFNQAKITGVLGQAMDVIKDQQQISEDLAEVPMSTQEAQLHLIKAFGNPDKQLAEQPKIIQTCLRLFNGDGQGSGYLTTYNTAYGLLEAVKEGINWYSSKRDNNTVFSSLCYGARGKKINTFEKQLVSVCLG